MVYIYEKNLATQKSKLYLEVTNENQAKKIVRDLNLESLYDDLFYYIGEKPKENA